MGIGSSTYRVCIQGAPRSGKSTIINKLAQKPLPVSDADETITIETTSFPFHNIHCETYEVGGHLPPNVQSQIPSYRQRSHGLVLVIDATDISVKSIDNTKHILNEMLTLVKSRPSNPPPILILVNKTDHKSAQTEEWIKVTYELDRGIFAGYPWHLAFISAWNNEGLIEAWTWLVSLMTGSSSSGSLTSSDGTVFPLKPRGRCC